jgi:hypothetical protein
LKVFLNFLTIKIPIFIPAAIPPIKKMIVSQGEVLKCLSSQYPTTTPPTKEAAISKARVKNIPYCFRYWYAILKTKKEIND